MIENIPLLMRSALLRGISEAALSEVGRQGSIVSVKAHSVFFEQGDEVAYAFILISGRVRIIQSLREGKQTILHLIHPGESFGLSVWLRASHFPVSAYADKPSAAWRCDRRTFEKIIEAYPCVARNAVGVSSERLQEMYELVSDISTARVEKRIARTLIRLSSTEKNEPDKGFAIDGLSHQDLAEMTGTTLFSVSRILSQWEKAGVIEVGRKKVNVLNGSELCAIVCSEF